jgi:hypothetical protein
MGLNPTLTMIEIYSDQATLYLWLYSIFSIFILINVMHYQFSPVSMVVDPPLPATLHHMGPPPHASSTWSWHPLALRPMGPSPATWTSPPCRSLDQSRQTICTPDRDLSISVSQFDSDRPSTSSILRMACCCAPGAIHDKWCMIELQSPMLGVDAFSFRCALHRPGCNGGSWSV